MEIRAVVSYTQCT